MTHEKHTVCFEASVSNPAESAELNEATRMLHDQLVAYCDRYGYLSENYAVEVRPMGLVTDRARLVASATLVARYDGEWGSVRRALEEDGLLRPSDRADAPAGFWGDPDPVHTAFGPEPMPSPVAGDLWYDIREGRLHVYGDDGWVPATVPDPDPVPELWWPADEICVRPEIVANRAHWKQLYEGVWTHEAIEAETIVAADGSSRTLSAGDSITWTTTVNLTAD